MRASQIDTE